MFAWMPTETLIRQHQAGYYAALQASREPEIDAAAFINYMLGIITDSLTAYEALAKAEVANVGVNVGVNEAIIVLLRVDPTLSAATLAERLGKTSRTIERHLADLKQAGRIRREGSDRAGRWVVIDK